MMQTPWAPILPWALATAAGYAQWFILFPRAVRRLVLGKPPARDDDMTTNDKETRNG